MISNPLDLPLPILIIASAAIIVATIVVAWVRRRFFIKQIHIPGKVVLERHPEPSDEKPAGQPDPQQPAPSVTNIDQSHATAAIAASGDITVETVVGGDAIDAHTVIKYSTVTIRSQSLPEKPPAGSGIQSSAAAKYIVRGDVEEELRAALRNRETTAIVGVGGMGGLGKTELAIQLANELPPEEVLWITVAERTLEDVHREMARALGVSFGPSDDRNARRDVLRAAFQKSPRTLFLDDIRASFKNDLGDCLPPSPPCAVLVTSRQGNLPGLAAGALRSLDFMTAEQALALLSAVSGLPEALQVEPEATKQLIEKCARHPLALSLAAKRLLKRLQGDVPIAAFVEGLTNRMAELATGDNPLDSLSANFELSHAELSKVDQKRFQQLAVFPLTGFGVAAAAAVCDCEEAELRMTTRALEDESLLLLADAPDRFRLHDLIRDYARKKLSEAHETSLAFSRLAEFVVRLFDEHYTDDPGSAPHILLEIDTLSAAADWALAERKGDVLAQLSTKARNWMVLTDRWDMWMEWLEEARQIGIEDRGLEANTLRAIGDVQQFRKDTDAALTSYNNALELYRATGARLGEANTLLSLGELRHYDDDSGAAIELFTKALGLFREIDDRYSVARALYRIGDSKMAVGATDEACNSYERAAELWSEIGLDNLVDDILAERIARACGDS